MALTFGVLTYGALTMSVPTAHAISGGSASPSTLQSSGQAITISFSGKDTSGPASNLVVEQCVAKDSDARFDPTVDCSSLSRQFFYGVPESGEVRYGGDRAANPTAPFVGVDPVNAEWSLCDEDSGVTNHQAGYLRVADTPDDLADDLFVPLACVGSGSVASTKARKASGVPLALMVPLGAAVAVGAALVMTRHSRIRARTQSRPRSVSQQEESRTDEASLEDRRRRCGGLGTVGYGLAGGGRGPHRHGLRRPARPGAGRWV